MIAGPNKMKGLTPYFKGSDNLEMESNLGSMTPSYRKSMKRDSMMGSTMHTRKDSMKSNGSV